MIGTTVSTLLTPTCASGVPPATSAQASSQEHETLAFDVREGDIRNQLFRRGRVAAHVLTTSGAAPRLIVAFPAGDTGIAVWFEPTATPVELAVQGGLSGVERPDEMRGVSALLASTAPMLRVRRVLLGSIRFIRELGRDAALPAWLAATVEASGPGAPIAVKRTTLDGEHHIELSIEPRDGTTATLREDGQIELAAGPAGLHVRITALADDEPLTPVPLGQLLNERAADEPRHRQALAFLTYREKLLAGSWRFLTYFGRDTLLAVRMLMPALQPDVIEAGLGSVLDRLSPEGDVAHEEAIGELAAFQHLAAGRARDLREPIYDYKMIDDDFLLAPVAAEYLLGSASGRERAAAFLARRTRSGDTYAEALARNLALVLRLTAPFAETGSPRDLISLKPGEGVGEWRDSEEGLGFGRIPFDVNVALVPAALAAAARLLASPLVGADPAARASSARAAELARAWRRAGAFFKVELPELEAKRRVAEYAASLGVDPAPALASVNGPLTFSALALDADCEPIPIMHSDDSFVLLFTNPPPATLEEAAGRLLRPFPAGLRTPVGIVVANPALAPDPSLRALFTAGRYHGTVVWSWQQAMLAAGLDRQLARADLPASTRAVLSCARAALREVILASRQASSSELWTWAVERGRYTLVPFGAERAHQDESNAVQLWSTVYLAVRP
jgi:hypothetical protein